MTEDFYERLLDVSKYLLVRACHHPDARHCSSWSFPSTAVQAIVWDGHADAKCKLRNLYGAYNDAELPDKAEKFYSMLKDRVEGTSLDSNLTELRSLINQIKEN